MEYSNQEIPEGINYSRAHPLKEFVVLTTGVLGTLFVVILLIAYFADKLAHHIPYSFEQDVDWFTEASEWPDKSLQQYLQGMADQIAADLDMPEGMQVKVHYNDSNLVNAYATLGGHVVFYKGLLEKAPNEPALAMVMAHEIAHLKDRHPIRSLGKGVVIMIAVSMLGSAGDSMVANIAGSTGTVTLLRFSREHESEADDLALERIGQLYGHVNGAEALFKAIRSEHTESSDFQVPFLQTHPNIEDRIMQIEKLAAEHAEMQPAQLPENYNKWLEASES